MKATLLATFGEQRMLTSSTASAWHASSILLATVEDSVKVAFSGFVYIGGMYRRLLRHLAFGRQLRAKIHEHPDACLFCSSRSSTSLISRD